MLCSYLFVTILCLLTQPSLYRSIWCPLCPTIGTICPHIRRYAMMLPVSRPTHHGGSLYEMEKQSLSGGRRKRCLISYYVPVYNLVMIQSEKRKKIWYCSRVINVYVGSEEVGKRKNLE